MDFGAVQTLVEPRSQQLCASQVAPSSLLHKGLVTQVNPPLADRLRRLHNRLFCFILPKIRGVAVIYFVPEFPVASDCVARLFAVVDF